jgi:hypothetical protein
VSLIDGLTPENGTTELHWFFNLERLASRAIEGHSPLARLSASMIKQPSVTRTADRGCGFRRVPGSDEFTPGSFLQHLSPPVVRAVFKPSESVQNLLATQSSKRFDVSTRDTEQIFHVCRSFGDARLEE